MTMKYTLYVFNITNSDRNDHVSPSPVRDRMYICDITDRDSVTVTSVSDQPVADADSRGLTAPVVPCLTLL